MKNLFLFMFLLVLSTIATAQITFRLTQVPANTPSDATLYFAANINNWTANGNALTHNPDGTYQVTVNPTVGSTIEFKFTRGTWVSVEGDANGSEINNRTYTYTGGAVTVNLQVLSWKDLTGTSHTATGWVTIMAENFYMPQLDRNRRIWVYLPPDYSTTNKHYPVIYMQDGQNLMDAYYSFSGEWEVDETLENLHLNGDYGAIVVGIDNGGASRLDEYSPWNNPSYGGGEGQEYISFLVETLKPYIDQNYRTLPQQPYTAIMGSSMGALISLCAAIEHPTVFGKVGIFSPAFWFSYNQLMNYLANHPKQENIKFYFVCGGAESTNMIPDMNAVYNQLVSNGYSTTGELFKTTVANGQHSEWFWEQEFPAAYQWLLGGVCGDPVIVGNNIGCSTQTQNYSVVNPIVGATYTWTATGGTILSGQGTPAVSVQWNTDGAGVISVVKQ